MEKCSVEKACALKMLGMINDLWPGTSARSEICPMGGEAMATQGKVLEKQLW